VIAIVVANYADAAEYMEQVATHVANWDPASHSIAPPSTEWLVVVRPEDVRGQALSGAVFLGDRPVDADVLAAVRDALTSA
jgi:hypothetical protein